MKTNKKAVTRSFDQSVGFFVAAYAARRVVLPVAATCASITSASIEIASWCTWLHRASFVNGELPSFELCAVEHADSFVSVGIIGELDESEAF